MKTNLLSPEEQDLLAALPNYDLLAALHKHKVAEHYYLIEQLYEINPDEYFRQKEELIKSSRFYEAPKSEELELDIDWD